METQYRKYLGLACIFLAACGRFGGVDEGHPKNRQAAKAEVSAVGHQQGVTPFIANVSLTLNRYEDLASVSFSVAPKPDTFSRALAITYDKAWLERRRAFNAGDKRLAFPVFGLYANHRNEVTLTLTFRDGSAHAEKLTVETAAFTGQAAIYGAPEIRTARTASDPGLDYMVIKNGIASPVVVDTDGNLRWVGSGLFNSVSSLLKGDAFFVGSPTSPQLYQVQMDGTFTTAALASGKYTNFHHELAPGKTGLLAALDATENGVNKPGTLLVEISPGGELLKEWDLGAILRKHMADNGDNPADFVRDGADWFQLNSAVYSAKDDSLLVSSREHFVAKLDYETGRIKWLLGDTTKHWYVNHPSLRALALRLTAGKAPIGQHGLSIVGNGELLLSNNGLGSLHQPAGAPRGATRTSSAPSRYAIDETARTAREVWTDEREREIFSSTCSSVHEASANKYLVAYALASGRTRAKVTAVDSTGKVAFDFEYPASVCSTTFMVQPIQWTGATFK